MSDLSPADIAARVVAWHNRHPLARRLVAADVHSVGHVALPFIDPAAPPEPTVAAAGSLRERAMARAREAPPPAAPRAAGPLQPAFRDDFIPPLPPAEVGAFAARHGIERPAEPTGAPLRRVPPQAGGGGLAWRWVLTAELRAGGARTRVLLGPAPGAPVLGRRLWSLPRVGALAAMAGAGGALVLALGLLDTDPLPVAALPGTPAPVVAGPGAGPASAPVAPVAPASAPASAPAWAVAPADAPASALVAAAEPPPAAASAAAPLAAASRPLDVAPRLGRVELPPIGGIVDARRREAAERAAAAASAGAAPAGGGATAAAAPAAAASAPVFALTTRLLRTRTESRQIAEALTALLVVPGSPVQRVDVLPAGDDFRVVAWPYPGRADAERAQAALQARGHRLQIISF